MTLHGKLWYTMVSMVYHGVLPWFTVIYHGLPVSKHHGILWHLPYGIFSQGVWNSHAEKTFLDKTGFINKCGEQLIIFYIYTFLNQRK